MAYSDEYLRQLRKRTSGKEKAAAETVRCLLFDYLSEIPGDLCWDIFNFFCDINENSSTEEMNIQKAERLALVIDLFEGEYDEKNIPLADDELSYICEGVNDFALDINDETLMNVMKAAVARGLMG